LGEPRGSVGPSCGEQTVEMRCLSTTDRAPAFATRAGTSKSDVVSGSRGERGGKRPCRGASEGRPAAPGRGGLRCRTAWGAALRWGAGAKPHESGGPAGNCAARRPGRIRGGPSPPGWPHAARRKSNCHAAGAPQPMAAGSPRHAPALPALTRASRAVPASKTSVSSYFHYNRTALLAPVVAAGDPTAAIIRITGGTSGCSIDSPGLDRCGRFPTLSCRPLSLSHEDLVYPVAVHVQDFKPEPTPLKLVAG
jgi:hypothetical protein